MSGDPFVGRAGQLAQLRGWADEVAEAGVGRFVLVVGEAGAGKTRLCSEFARLPLPAAVAWSRCWAGGGGPPLWPWPDLVAELGNKQNAPPDLTSATGHPDRFELFRTTEEQLRGLCVRRPAVALIDDLHAANHDVLLLTRFIARSLHRFPLLLVVTWRTDTSSESSDELATMEREASVVDLPPFSASDVATYLELSDHDPTTPEEISRLVDCTGGNPMYVAEIVRQGSTDEAARAGGLALVLARRVADVSAARRRVVGAAALLGTGATVTETADVLGCRPAEALEVLTDEALGVTLVGNDIRFSHDLLRAAYVAAVPINERQQLHVAARDAIVDGDADRLVRRAYHAVQAAPLSPEHASKAVAACIDAAAMLHRASAFEQAAEWAVQASALASGGSDPAAEATALVTHAGAVLACGRLAEARELFAKAMLPAEAATDPRLMARAALGFGGVWVEEQRNELSRRRLLTLCRRALAALPPDETGLAARLAVRIAAEHAYDGTGTVADVAAAVERVRGLGDPEATAEALSLYHHTLLLLPDAVPVRLEVADELLDVASNTQASIYSLFGLCWRTVDLYHLGDGEAERAFVSLRERATALGSQAVGYIVAVLDVMRALRRGELGRIEALADEALALGVAAGDADALAYYGAHLLAVRWAQGRVGELHETIASVIESSTLRRRDQIYPALLAYANALRGDHTAARSALDSLLAGGLDAIPHFSTWAGTMAVLVETAAELDDSHLAMALAERFAPVAHLPVMPSLAVVCLGPGERVMGRAMTTAGRLDEAITWLRGALTANRRLGNRPFDALIRADLAVALRLRGAAGDDEEAAELLASAVSGGRRLGMAGWVERWEADAAGLGDRTESNTLQATLERDDGNWHLEIGGRSATVGHVIGLRYVAELVIRPDTDIAASDLSAAIFGGGTIDHGPGAPALDSRARDEYRLRLGQLERELDAADHTGDVDRSRRATEERDLLLDALRRESGLGGRARRMTDESERCRMRVSKAIHRAVERVRDADPVLGRMLELRIRTGYVCCYVSDPGQPIAWTVRTRGPNASD